MLSYFKPQKRTSAGTNNVVHENAFLAAQMKSLIASAAVLAEQTQLAENASGDDTDGQQSKSRGRFFSPLYKLKAFRLVAHLGFAAAQRKLSTSTGTAPHAEALRLWRKAGDKALSEYLQQVKDQHIRASQEAEDAWLLAKAFPAQRGQAKKVPKEMKDFAYEQFKKRRALGKTVRTDHFRTWFMLAQQKLCPDMTWFKCSDKFLLNFKQDYHISKRRPSTARKRLVLNTEQLQDIMALRIAHLVHDEDGRLIIGQGDSYGMDETLFRLNPTEGATYEVKGSKHVEIAGLDDSRAMTAIVWHSMDGFVGPPAMIWDGTTQKSLPQLQEWWPSGTLLQFNKRGWSTDEAIMEWLDKSFVPAVQQRKLAAGKAADSPTLLVWDVYTTHKKAATYVKDKYPWLKLAFIVANATNVLQVADVSINKPLKVHYAKHMDQWEDAERKRMTTELLSGAQDTGMTDDDVVRALEQHLHSKPLRRNASACSIVRALMAIEAETVTNGVRAAGLARVWNSETSEAVWKLAKARDAEGTLWNRLTPRGMPLSDGTAASAGGGDHSSAAAVNSIRAVTAPAPAKPSRAHKRPRNDPSEPNEGVPQASPPRTCGWCRHVGHDKRNCPIRASGGPPSKATRYKNAASRQ